MPTARCACRAVLALILAAALAACAPRLAPPGPGPTTPALTESALRTPDGLQLPLRRWMPPGDPKAIILGLHGFNDYSLAFELPGSYLSRRGIAVYAYDQRGFGANPDAGLWPGTEALVADLRTAVRLLRRRHPDTPIFLMGTSMGGAVILAAAGRDALPAVDGVILAAPAVWARRTMPFYQRWALWLTAHTVPWLQLSGANLDIQATDNLVELRALGYDPLVIKATRVDSIYGLTDLMSEALDAGGALRRPALVLYGEKDEIVPADPTLQLWRQLDGDAPATFGLYSDGWHMLLRDLQAYTVWRDIEAWIDADLAGTAAGLPSPADERARSALALGEIPVPDGLLAAGPGRLGARPDAARLQPDTADTTTGDDE